MKDIISDIKEYALSIVLTIIIGILIANNVGLIHLNINWNNIFECYIAINVIIVGAYVFYKTFMYLLFSPKEDD